ncbi:MAG TPA: YggT family protein [Aggregatilineales bacterium]|nr:YggT family protein [Anaerolineae bacterium]HUN08953.1 YggT family protein [Aggregatilineales bacterium]
MSIVGILYTLLQIYSFILLARVLLSWFPNIDRSNQIVQFLYDVTEPVLKPIRDMLPQNGMMDFSPLIAFLIITVLTRLLTSISIGM